MLQIKLYPRGHSKNYTVSYKVDNSISGNPDKISREHAMAILHHVRDRLDHFVSKEKPRSIEFGSALPIKQKLHDHLSDYLIKKHGGWSEVDTIGGMYKSNTVIFNHDNKKNRRG